MRYKQTILTSEQEAAALAIINKTSLTIQAPAGSGKTATLLAGARKLRGNGLNLSFNKSIAISASKKFPKNCQCKTGHSLAFGSIGWKYKDRLTKLTGRYLSELTDIGKPRHFRTPAAKGYYILETIRNFCYSSSKTITKDHIPNLPITVASKEIYSQLTQNLLDHATRIWKKQSSQSESLPITHDTYLKLWALSEPNLSKDFILFDEAQDANPVMLDIILKQQKINPTTQLVFVGDACQQIYSWRGAINALQSINLTPYYLTKSFRFGQPIADMANQIISSYAEPANRIPPITGIDMNSSIDTNYSQIPDCVICRTNAGVIRITMEYLEKSYKIHILGGVTNLISLITGIDALSKNQRSFHPELMLFNSYSDLMEYIESPMGGDLKYLVKLIEEYGFNKLITTLHSTEKTSTNADITITTVHKAKGLEWPVVKLANDFPYPEDNQPILQEETNILYVAATRAINILDISHCNALDPINLSIGQKIWEERTKLGI